MSRGLKGSKSIYSKIKELPPARPLPVFVHGDKLSAELHGVTARLTNVNLARVRLAIETLKLSAAHSGSYSLSANQIGISNSIFVIHKELIDGVWCHPEAQAILEATPASEEGLGVTETQFFQPLDFEAYINPRVLMETKELVFDWEYCTSFPNIRCMVKRPTGIVVSYLDETGTDIERAFSKFHARVFLHELDHINGRTMTHWRISEGNIDILDGQRDRHPNLMTTVDFYKAKIDELKDQFEEQMFKDDRKFEEVKIKEEEWKKFTPDRKEDIFKIPGMSANSQPSFEETMTMDTIKAMRRDRRD